MTGFNTPSILRVWTWAGLPPAIQPPRGGRTHRLKDEPVREPAERGAKKEGAKWGNQHTANKYCVLCGRETRDALQVRLAGQTSRNHKCCIRCQYEITRDHSRRALLDRVKDAVRAQMKRDGEA